MERPQITDEQTHRSLTGEIVYLDESRRNNEAPRLYQELGESAIQMYERQAAMYGDDERPAIMDEYEQHDHKPSEAVASCKALADELLALKNPDSTLTFEDFVVEVEPEAVLDKLASISAGSVLAANDEQLAIQSKSEYYPLLDIRKQNAKLIGVGLRVWGWDDKKYVYATPDGESYKYPDHLLMYPSNEKNSTRELELTFGYMNDSTRFTESVSLYIYPRGSVTISSQVWADAYAETGYEGHGGRSLEKVSDKEIAAFGDLIAETVGDEPKSVAMAIRQQLQELIETAATASAQQAVQNLIELTWPAQANYLLTRSREGEDRTIAELLHDEATAEAAVAAIEEIISGLKPL